MATRLQTKNIPGLKLQHLLKNFSTFESRKVNKTTLAATNQLTPTSQHQQATQQHSNFSTTQQTTMSSISNTQLNSTNQDRVLTINNLNPHVKSIEYAVRGPIVIRAGQIEEELRKGISKPFDQVIRANIGDCHACGQKPISYLRQLVALCAYPDLMSSSVFKEDVKEKARRVLNGCFGASLGSYTESVGLRVVREDVARYIEERDGGIPCNPDDIFLTNGASDAIKTIMKMLLTGKDEPKAGIMLPVPVYPLYTALLSEFNSVPIPYYLNEDDDWSLDINELQRALNEAKQYCVPRGIVVINPGNPTGQVLTPENISDVIKFSRRENIYLMADEVYQHNVYAEGSSFNSFKKVLHSMGDEYSNTELASFMSTSKGYMGECGFRGGYCEVLNMCKDVKYQLNKSISAMLCSTVPGQAAMDAVVNPPKPGDESYEEFIKEKTEVLGGLKEKAQMTSELLNKMEGITCRVVAGAMYAFPRLHLPENAVMEAKKRGVAADVLYCTELLEETGICVVPGSGFGQKPGTFHFRMTILPPPNELKSLLSLLSSFNQRFHRKYQ